jgi:hypothetical protein
MLLLPRRIGGLALPTDVMPTNNYGETKGPVNKLPVPPTRLGLSFSQILYVKGEDKVACIRGRLGAVESACLPI